MFFTMMLFSSSKPCNSFLFLYCLHRCAVTDIPKISAAILNEKWTTADNRRLWVFRHLERLGKCEQIEVFVVDNIPERKKTSNNGGGSIVVRGTPGGEWHEKTSVNSGPSTLSFIHTTQVNQNSNYRPWYRRRRRRYRPWWWY